MLMHGDDDKPQAELSRELSTLPAPRTNALWMARLL